MSTRSTRTTVTFRHAFTLSSVEGTQPAGTYRVSTEEKHVDGLSSVAFDSMTALLFLPAGAGDATCQVVTVDPKELAAALDTDAGP